MATPESKRKAVSLHMKKLRSDPERLAAHNVKRRAYYHAKGKLGERAYYDRMKVEAPWAWRARNAKRNCSPFITEEWLRVEFEKQEGRCALTGRPITVETFEIDHILPRSRGGSDDRSNLRLLCAEANQAKGAMTDGEFRALCEELIGNAILSAMQEAA